MPFPAKTEFVVTTKLKLIAEGRYPERQGEWYIYKDHDRTEKGPFLHYPTKPSHNKWAYPSEDFAIYIETND
jgi:hypothetical protein